MKNLRIGILSTAGIGKKNWKAIFNSGNCVVSAVASRNLQKSRKFIGDCQREIPFGKIPDALGSYEELFGSKNVDAVYIPLPTGLRKEWVVRAARAGKHVICEKPCAVNSADLEIMISACTKNRVQFMDGVMFMHNARLPKIRKLLDDGKSVGEIRRISSAFSFLGGGNFSRNNIRTDGALEPAGCLGDLGWYCLRFILWAMKGKLPRAVTGKILSQSAATSGRLSAPTEFSAELFFDDGVSANFYCSFLAQRQQWISVIGEKGNLWMPDFVHPFNTRAPAFEINQSEIRVQIPGAKNHERVAGPMDMGHPTAQETIMFRNFAKQIFSGKLNEDWPMWALQTQKVLDECLAAAKSS
ncbi:MAG TPA: Gfo/Idh/MocA family oxidoreductase [Verrucomicrobiae bacterium]